MPEETETTEATEAEDYTPHPGNLHNKLRMEWKTPEFIHHEKTARWFLMAGLLIVALIAYAVYTDSATMAIVFIVLAGVYYLTHNQQPKIIDIKITDLGIFVGEKFYHYNEINSFWIVYHPPFVHTLNLRLGTKGRPRITIQLNQQNPVDVRKALAKEIPEVEGEGESMTEMITRMLRL